MEIENNLDDNNRLDDTNYFAHIPNETIVDYYSKVLNSTTELIQLNYPEDWPEGDDAIIEHINKCVGAVMTKLQIVLLNSKSTNGESLSSDLIRTKLKEKQEELAKLFLPLEEKYFTEVKVTYIELRDSVSDIDFEGRDWSQDQEL